MSLPTLIADPFDLGDDAFFVIVETFRANVEA
jgi:hypothetical protein